jgi:hypothetical protein
MSAKRFNSPGVMIVLLAILLVGGGCATTSSQNAQYKPHRPQMITANGPEEVGECPVVRKFNHGFDLSDEVADSVPFVIAAYCLRAICGSGISWKP